MAKVLDPLHSVQAVGTYDSIVYYRSNGLNFARNYHFPTPSASDKQTALRGLLTTQANAWTTLDPSQRIAWNIYAKRTRQRNAIGNLYSISGFKMFMRLSLNQIYTQGGFNSDPPWLATPNRITSFSPSSLSVGSPIICFLLNFLYPPDSSDYVEILQSPITLVPTAHPSKSQFHLQSYQLCQSTEYIINATPADSYCTIKARVIDYNGIPTWWVHSRIKIRT